MARPITWQNIGQPAPQFSNSGYGVAAEAFGSATDSARKLAEQLHKRDIEEQKKASAFATNDFIIQGLRDGKFTMDDLKNPAKNVDIGTALDKLQGFGKYQDDLATNTQTRAESADNIATNAISRQASQLEIDELNYNNTPERRAEAAKVRALELQAAQLKLQQAQLTGKITQSDYDRQQKSINAESAYNQWAVGNGEGSREAELRAEAEAMVQSELQPGQTITPDLVENTYKTLEAQYNVDHPKAELRKYLEVGGDVNDFYKRPEGQLMLHEQKVLIEQGAADAARINAANKNSQEGVLGVADKPEYRTIDSSGTTVYDSTAKKGTLKDAEGVASALKIDITDKRNKEIIATAWKAYPNTAMFEARIKGIMGQEDASSWNPFNNDKVTIFPEGAEGLLVDTIRTDKVEAETIKAELNKLPNPTKSARELVRENLAATNSANTSATSSETSSSQDSEIPGISVETAATNEQIITDIKKGTASVETIAKNLNPVEAEVAIKENMNNLEKKIETIQTQIKNDIPEIVKNDPIAMKEINRMSEELKNRSDTPPSTKYKDVPRKNLYNTEQLQAKVEAFDEWWARMLQISTTLATQEATKKQEKVYKDLEEKLIESGRAK